MPRSPTTPRATESIAPHGLPAGPLDGRYRLDGVIGRGGMGTVYRAIDQRLNRVVAVKVLHSVDGADVLRFEAEVQILARLVHPRLVRILDTGGFDTRPYLVMDLIEGSNLARRLGEGPLSPGETATVGADIASALAYVHGVGIVHRDVKPANVIIDAEGAANLSDFGIARLVDATGLTVTGLTLGTPAYLAPEQIEGAGIGPGTDVYALGLVLIECLTGRRAFEGTPSEVAGARLHRDPSIPAHVGDEWRHALSAMTARSPHDRPSAAQVATQLGRLGHDDVTELIATVPSPRNGATDATVPSSLGPTEWGVSVPLVRAEPYLVDPVTIRYESGSTPPEAIERGRRVTRVTRRAVLVSGGVLVAACLVVGLALGGAFSAAVPPSKGASGAGAGKSTSTVAPTSTTVATSSVTASPVATAAAALGSVIAGGVTDGTIAPQAGQQLATQLQPLVGVTTSTVTPSQIQQFDQLVQQISFDAQNGSIVGPATTGTLAASIARVASAMGTSVPNGTAGTTTGPPDTPGHGHGHGRGNDA